MEKKTKIWILIFAALIIICGLVFAIQMLSGKGTVADISIDGELYESIDLSLVSEPYTIEIDTQYGHNTILVEKNKISVCDADCADHICVDQGAIHQSGIPIICMPHRLVIQIEGGDIIG